MFTRCIEDRLRALEDVQAIQILKWRYLRACDEKRPDEVCDCFLPDAVIDFEGFPCFSHRNVFVETFREMGCRPNVIDMHHGQNPIVEVTGSDTARGWFDCFFFQIDTSTRRMVQLAVSYDDVFVRQDGRWWIARSTSRRRSMLVQEIGPDHVARIAVADRSDAPGPPPPPR